MSAEGKKVLIVGSGMAGLACAVRLLESGFQPFLFEASDGVGGRVRTDLVDGFLLDRGFQVYLDAYPETGRLLDKKGLDLRSFKPGALVHQSSGMKRVMDVFREPRHLMESAMAPVGGFTDKLRVAAMRWRLIHQTVQEIAEHDDMTSVAWLQRAGFSTRMIDGFFRSFYGGIFLERELGTSSRMFEFTFKMFSKGNATLPAKGMQEIPRHLALRLPPGSIRLGERVLSVSASDVVLASGERIVGDHVVLATDMTSIAEFGMGGGVDERHWRSVTCLYFATDKSPLHEAIIALNGTGTGLINHVCVPSDVAPDYAPPGQALISVSILGSVDQRDLESRILAELETWFGRQVRKWRHLRTYKIERSLPEQPPGLGLSGSGFRKVNGAYLCGDHLWSASIEGAVISGLRAADAILQA